ncbi:MAG TPA: DUF3168 domain-containing protein [Allosphingosinicella sp.]|nr:DUF3168 domain-containing protein [Allosphingosinicella sp.]
MSAGQALTDAMLAALREIEGLNQVYDGQPLTAAFPYALVETGPESDWSHKTGEGRELRLSILVHDKGERPIRLRRLVAAVEEIAPRIVPDLESWQLVNLVFLRAAMLREAGAAWTAAIEYRARLLRA